MFEILISGEIRKALPEVRLGCLNAVVRVEPSDSGLLMQIDKTCDHLKSLYSIEEVSKTDIITDTKTAYRKLGKDPSRYRPSAEALTRRVVQGKGLYRVNNIVDALNMISIKHGFSIGGYDLDTVNGRIELGIGKPDEPYEAIGRGLLNIENLPVLRDQKGVFGSPTSDSMRTMVRVHTMNFLMIFFDFIGSGRLEGALNDAVNIYRNFCGVKEIETTIY